MKEKDFDTLIELERERELPTCPGNLEANVLRRIRLESAAAGNGWGVMEWIFGQSRTGLMLGSLALTVLFSTVATIVVTSTFTSSLESRNLAAHALDFNILKDIPSVVLDH